MSEAAAAVVPPPSGRRDLLIDIAWLVVLAVWCNNWCESAAARIGFTYDEPLYLEAGLINWRLGHPGATAINGVMPMPVNVVTIPLYRHELALGKEAPREEVMKQLPEARRMTLYWLALLILAVMRLGQIAGGPWAGRIASGLIAADPNFLVHSSLATTDISVTAALLALTLSAYTGQSQSWVSRIVIPGVWFGVAVMCKLSALLYGGIILVALEVTYWFASGALVRSEGMPLKEWTLRVAKTVTRSVLVVAAIIGIGVGFTIVMCGTSAPGVKPMTMIFKKIPKNEALWPRYKQYAEDYDEVPYAVVAFAFQAWHNSHGRPAFINGTYYPEGCWFHFPLLMAMKIPLPVMVLAVVMLFRFRRAFNPFLLAALLLLLATLTAKLQIGIRLVFPIMAIGYLGVAVGVVRGFGRCGVIAGLVAVAVTAGVSNSIWPHGLGYLNQLAGGPSAAPELVTDSNLDWGQGIPELLEWHEANGKPEIALWYFGGDPLAWKKPFYQVAPETVPIVTGDDLRRFVGGRVLAVGTTVLTLQPEKTPSKRDAIAYLRTLTPIGRTPTFVIYDLRESAPRGE